MSMRSKRRYYARMMQEKKKNEQRQKEYSRLAYDLYQAMDTHTHSDPTGKEAVINMKRRFKS